MGEVCGFVKDRKDLVYLTLSPASGGGEGFFMVHIKGYKSEGGTISKFINESIL